VLFPWHHMPLAHRDAGCSVTATMLCCKRHNDPPHDRSDPSMTRTESVTIAPLSIVGVGAMMQASAAASDTVHDAFT
jgi:hypothetical protein